MACPSCGGTRFAKEDPECLSCGWMPEPDPSCDHCGEPATRKAPYSDQPICDECHTQMYEDGGDSPLGGMGYGIDYREAQAEARRLK